MQTGLASDIGQGALIEEIRCEQEPLLMAELGQGLCNGHWQAIVCCRRICLRIRSKVSPMLNLFIETDILGMEAAAIDVLPREHGAEPAFEGAAAHVVVELRDAVTLARGDSVK